MLRLTGQVSLWVAQCGLAPSLGFGPRQLALVVSTQTRYFMTWRQDAWRLKRRLSQFRPDAAPQLLRRQINEHWDPAFKKPALDDEERAAIRAQLLNGLADPDRKLRTAAGMALAAIAKFEMPESPMLVQQLLAAVDRRDNPSLGQ